MRGKTWFIPALLIGLISVAPVWGQRGGRGGGRAGGGGARGGMTRPSGGGMARPGDGSAMAQRPSMPAARPSGGMTRPNISAAASRAGGAGMQRPAVGGGGNAGARPGSGLAGNMRPTTPPTGIGGGNATQPSIPPTARPGGGNIGAPGGANRPTPGGNQRPGPGSGIQPGGGQRPGPGTGPGTGGNRPGGGNNLLPGDMTRPAPRPGGDQNRPGPGGVNRPGQGGVNRPGTRDVNRPGAGTNRPGTGTNPPWTRPPGSTGANRPGGVVNRPNTGVVNRPNNNNNVSGNWFGNRNVTNINNNYFGGGGWGHGGWGGYGPGRWGGYRPWASPYYGYHGGWYYGSWNRNYFGNAFWGGFTGAMLGNMAYGMFNLFPTWGSYGYSSWGLQPIVANSYYANYSNPYYSMPVAVVGQSAPTIVYNYNQPLATVADTSQAQPNQVESAETTFTQAREAFKAGDFSRAMILSDQAIAAVPGDSAMHEFRALCLYALKRYDEASAVLYSVLTAGPGWSWSTMIGLYADADVYTQQLRELEAYVRANPNSASARFDLAYHYMTQGHTESAAEQFTAVTALQPKDELSAKFVKALTPPAGAEAAVAANPPAPGAEAPAEPAAETEQPEPAPPPANMAGVWNAKPDPTLDITLDLKEGGDFTWKVQPKTGQPQTISGKAYFRDGQLALTQEQGAPLVGQVETPDAHTLKFTLAGGENAPTLVFKK